MAVVRGRHWSIQGVHYCYLYFDDGNDQAAKAITKWCEENLQEDFSCRIERNVWHPQLRSYLCKFAIKIENERDAVLFKMTWIDG